MVVAEALPVQGVSSAPEQCETSSPQTEEHLALKVIEKVDDELFRAGLSEEADEIIGLADANNRAHDVKFAVDERTESSVDQAETEIEVLPEIAIREQEFRLQEFESAPIPVHRTELITSDQSDQPDQADELVLAPLENPDEHHLFESEDELNLADSTVDDPAVQRPMLHEFQFACSICHSLIAASTMQIGEFVKCFDCETAIRVPQPDPLSLRPVGTFFQTDVNKERFAETEFGISDAIELPKFDLPNIDLLGEDDSLLTAPRSVPGSTKSPPVTGKPQSSAQSGTEFDRKPVQSIAPKPVGYLTNADGLDIKSLGEFLAFVPHANLIFRWITLSLILTAELVLFQITTVNFGSSDLATRMTGLLLVFPTLLMLLVYLVAGFVFGANVLDQTAAGRRTIDQWPEFEFFGWLSRSFFCVTSFWLSSLPGLAISLSFTSLSFWYWIAAPLLAISILILFPVLLFSVICNQQAWNPISRPVWDSFKICRASWKQFYAYSGIILAAASPLLLLQIWPNFFTSAILATAFSFLFFVYFRLLGYLGRALSKHLEISNPT